MQEYTRSKLKIFNLQDETNFALINNQIKSYFKKNKYSSKLTLLKLNDYKKVKIKIENSYLRSKINDQNMIFVYTLSKLLKISNKSFVRSMNKFKGLAHRYEFFLQKKILYLSTIQKQLVLKQVNLL